MTAHEPKAVPPTTTVAPHGPDRRPSGGGDDDEDQQQGEGGKDLAIALVGARAHAVSAAATRRAVRKTDRFLIPAMCVGYGLVYYDKAILGSAALFGMTADLGLAVAVAAPGGGVAIDMSRLSWATSLFYLGMLAGLYPLAFALQRAGRPRAVLGAAVVLWSAVCMLAAAVTSWRGLYAQRFALGFVESVIPTAFMMVVSGSYAQQEQALRQSWWFCSTGWWTVIGGGLNYGFAQVTGGGLKRWQYIYLLAGSLTFLFGLLCFALPDSPLSAWFLSEEERVAAVERLRAGQTGVRCERFKWGQVREALLDVKVWLVAVMMASA